MKWNNASEMLRAFTGRIQERAERPPEKLIFKRLWEAYEHQSGIAKAAQNLATQNEASFQL